MTSFSFCRHGVAAILLCFSPMALADDTPTGDAALAEQIFEQKRKAREIVQWARDRAWEAVLNSPTGQVSVEMMDEFKAQCETDIARSAELGMSFGMTLDECVEARARTHSSYHSDVVSELAERFIQERMEEERARLEKEVFGGLRRWLQRAQGLDDGSII